MRPGPPALCRGTVWHRRSAPTTHSFTYNVAYIWFDPDDADTLTDLHWAWSTGRFRPARVAADDYGPADGSSHADHLGSILSDLGSDAEVGDVRLLTQPRRWGWLFNPISLYLIWPPEGGDRPTNAVLEVTNTPWKERHHYGVALVGEEHGDVSEATVVGATFDKGLHVSPFLPMDMTYHLRVSESRTPFDDDAGSTLTVAISVSDDTGDTVLETGMTLSRETATRRNLTETLLRDGFPTHRTSGGIHRQAARLLTKGVPFVPHPRRSSRHGST